MRRPLFLWMPAVPEKEKTLLMIGNAHIDPVWLWRWEEGFAEVHATYRSALDRMRENADFIFTTSSAAHHEWVEKSDTDMFEEIRARVAEGRWRIVGGWWVQPDCNLPCGESFVRQGLYGQRYFHEKLGVTASLGYNVDSFGHNGMLPQILAKSGLKGYIFMRPSPHEKGLPGHLFWWESDDGSRVLAFRILYEYASWGDGLEQHVRRCAGEVREPFDRTLCFYGVGNHGGGPTRENLEHIAWIDSDPDMPRLQFAAPEALFDEVLARDLIIPVVHDDLQHHASGCYAAHSGVKRWNRQAENALLRAEKFASLANSLAGQPYPVAELAQAWKNVLFNQFHDILAGTSIEAAYDDARQAYGEAMAIAARAENYAVQSLAYRVVIPQVESRRAFVVFNPHAWPVLAPVEVEFSRLPDGEELLDHEGRPLPVQRLQPAAAARGRTRLCFEADLPPLGYRLYYAGPVADATNFAPLHAGECWIENDRLRLEINPATGCIRSLFDRQLGVEAFLGEAAIPVVLDDPTDTWSHDIYRYDRVLGRFEPQGVSVVENGPVRTIIRVRSRYGASELAQDFVLCAGSDAVGVHARVDWHEQHKVFKLRFPVNVGCIKATYEIPYGHIERFANGEEEPGQAWIDVSGEIRGGGTRYGVALLNDAKYSFDVNLNDVGMTVLRSPLYAHHVPYAPPEGSGHRFMDQGEHEFNYTILPHAGSWEDIHVPRRAAELNQRPVVVPATFNESGTLPPVNSFVSADRENIVVSAIKRAEDGDAVIVRAYETEGSKTDATIHLPALGRTIATQFNPCEIKTFKLPDDPALEVSEVNLIEW